MSKAIFSTIKGPLGLLVFGALRPEPSHLDSATGHAMLQMLAGECKLLDLGKLDLFSPAWLRVESSGIHSNEDPSGNDQARRWQSLLESFASHWGASSVELCGATGRASLSVEKLSNASGLEIPAVCVGVRFGPNSQPVAPSSDELCRAWMSCFQKVCANSLKSKRQGMVGWPDAPSRVAFAGLKSLFFGSCMDADSAALAQWPPAVLAQEQASALAKSVKSSKKKAEASRALALSDKPKRL